MTWLIALLALGVAPAQAQISKLPTPKTETIGSWIVACSAEQATDTTACRMRYRTWIVPPHDGRPNVGLEVRNIGAQMVPQLAVRDLPVQLAVAAMLAATPTMELRFDNGQKVAMACGQEGQSVLCTPEPGAAAAAASQLKTARSVQVHVHVDLAVSDGPSPVPDQTRSFDLSRTAEAMDRFRVVAPTALPLSTGAGTTQNLRGVADKMLQAMGYPGGVNDIVQKALSMVHSMMARTPQP